MTNAVIFCCFCLSTHTIFTKPSHGILHTFGFFLQTGCSMRIYSTVTMCNINQAIPRKSVEAVVTVGFCYKWETQQAVLTESPNHQTFASFFRALFFWTLRVSSVVSFSRSCIRCSSPRCFTADWPRASTPTRCRSELDLHDSTAF